jgi:hypothetical protein
MARATGSPAAIIDRDTHGLPPDAPDAVPAITRDATAEPRDAAGLLDVHVQQLRGRWQS